MNITVIGTGYVGLVTGVSLSEVGHNVICLDINEEKIASLGNGISPIYEPGIEELISKNLREKRLLFTTEYEEGISNAEIIYVALGTPSKADGSVDLSYIWGGAKSIAEHIKRDSIVVTKSTVPVGTNEKIEEIINEYKKREVKVDIVSNPEFLKEGSAIYDSFKGDRIVIGSNNKEALNVIEEINKPFGIPVYKTDLRSAEMIKYAANAFLATKISYINEISAICERVGANIEDVSEGIGMDERIGAKFLNAGIGYGGSCFPKDTNGLIQIAGTLDLDFSLLKSVINTNNKQKLKLVEKLLKRVNTLQGKKIAVLGLAFKPNTDDMRDAPSIDICNALLNEGATVHAFDPIAMGNAKLNLSSEIIYEACIENAIKDSDAALIVTEWSEIKNIDLNIFSSMTNPIVFDGRNCFDLDVVEEFPIEYHSIGRPSKYI